MTNYLLTSEAGLQGFVLELREVAKAIREQTAPVEPAFDIDPSWRMELPSLGSRLDDAYARDRKIVGQRLSEFRAKHPQSPLFVSGHLFDAMGLSHRETAHTRMLAWFLDPRPGRHDLGQLPLLGLMDAVSEVLGTDSPISAIVSGSLAGVSVVAEEWLDRRSRADIYISGKTSGRPWVIVIEAKVDSVESPNQTPRYSRTLGHILTDEETILKVLLTTDGEASEAGAESGWVPLSFRALMRSFMRRTANLEESAGSPFFSFYIASVLTDLYDIHTSPDSEVVIARNKLIDIDYLMEA